MAELGSLTEAAALTAWAGRILPGKNQLVTSDAQLIEAAFAAKLAELESNGAAAPSLEVKKQKSSDYNDGLQRDEPVAQAVLVIRKPVRERDRNHLRFVAAQCCLVCGRTPCDAHHLKFAEQRAMGRKVSDKFTVPLCRLHHRELHLRGNERAWWKLQKVEPLAVAAALWQETHGGEGVVNGETELDDRENENGKHVGRALITAKVPQNDETNPSCGAKF